MIERFFTPLERQLDDGFGMTGLAFSEAARLLANGHEGKLSFANGHLPINYLYRHSIELFLKSSLIIVHRALKLPSGDGQHQRDPLLKIDDRWTPLHRIHGLGTLLDELKRLLEEHKTRIIELTTHEWQIDPSLEPFIATIDEADETSTYFRYPRTKDRSKDAQKSGFQPITQNDAIAEMSGERKKGGAYLAMMNDDDEVVEVFGMQGSPVAELREALEKTSQTMSGVSLGLYAECFQGFGQKQMQWVREREAAEQAAPAPPKPAAPLKAPFWKRLVRPFVLTCRGG
jgi:hypothetical protein